MKTIQKGQGPTLVLSHALASDHTMWDSVADQLSNQYHVIQFDHRGHGGSPLITEPITIDDFAEDAAEVIRRHAQGPVVFAGLSLGGMVGQALAARYPQLLRGLVVLNSASHYADRSIWDARIEGVRGGGMQTVADGSLLRWLTPEFRATPTGTNVAQRMRQILLDTDAESYVHTCEALASMDLRESNRTITTPTLVIAGRQDLATPLSMSQAIADDIAGARLELVDGAHISTAEAADAIASLLHDWTSGLAR